MLSYLKVGLKGISIAPAHPFTGSTIRGVFGRGLKSAVCVCDESSISPFCVYHEFFDNVVKTPKYRLDITLNTKSYDFDIYLFDHATAYLPQVILALANMPHIGFGATPHPFSYEHITLNGTSTTNRPVNLAQEIKCFTPSFTSGDYKLTTITPLRIKQKNAYVKRTLDPKLLIRQITMRYGEMIGCSIAPFEVNCTHSEQNFTPYEIDRYSNRQAKKMELDGVMGELYLYGTSILGDPKQLYSRKI